MSVMDRIQQAKRELEEPKAKTSTGTIHEAIEVYLKSRWVFRYNTVLSCVEYKEHGAKLFNRLEDRHTNSMLRGMRYAGIKANKGAIDETVDSDFSKPYDPFHEYFDNLKPTNDRDFIKELANTVSLKDESERTRFEVMLKKWLVAMVGCATTEEHINETILIFVGIQGDGKTRWFKKIVPQELYEYQAKGTVNLDDKDSKTSLAECFLILFDELVTLRKNDIEAVKSLTSESLIRVRRPYERRAVTMHRRASFAGCDNNEDIINDPTGSRRFLIFSVGAIDYEHSIDVDGVWSQAQELFKSGERYWLDREEIAELNAHNDQYQIKSIEEELVNKYFTVGTDFFTATDMIKHINTNENQDGKAISLKSDQVTLRKIGGACKAIGFDKKPKKINGRSVRGYVCSASSQRGYTSNPETEEELPF